MDTEGGHVVVSVSLSPPARRIPNTEGSHVVFTWFTETSPAISHSSKMASALAEHEINVGDVFASYSQVEEAISAYEQHHFLQLYRRDSRSITAYEKRVTKRVSNRELRYSEVQFRCIRGGKKFASRSKGARPNQR